MSDLSRSLSSWAWEGVEFPGTETRTDGGHDSAKHSGYGQRGADIETTGAKPKTFSVTIPPEDRDPALRFKLRDELEGILAWAVRGAFEWYHAGLCDPEIVREATQAYRSDQDTFGDWIEECLTISEHWSETGSVVYKSFKEWCERQGMKPMANNKLANMLKDKGFKSTKNSAGRMEWVGIQVITEGHGGSEASPHLFS